MSIKMENMYIPMTINKDITNINMDINMDKKMDIISYLSSPLW